MLLKSRLTFVSFAILIAAGCAGAGIEDEEITKPSDIESPEVSNPNRPSGPDENPVVSPRPTNPLDCADTDTLQGVNPNALTPSSRIVSMRVPTTPQEAREMDCIDIAGSKGGLGLSTLLSALQVNLDDIVKRDEQGTIPSIILGHLDGWQEGQTGNQTDNVYLHMYNGIEMGGGAFGIGAENGDRSAAIFPAVLGCQTLETEPTNLNFDLPVDGGGTIPFGLESVTVRGDIAVRNGGFELTNGAIIGYISKSSIVRIVSDIQNGCAAAPGDPACESMSFLLGSDAQTVTETLVLPFLHGLDASIDPSTNRAQPCSGQTCDALSICIRFDSEPVNVMAN
ncbi:MAG: hypothetical protein ACON3Z_10745 [Bradymonadia bacterium]